MAKNQCADSGTSDQKTWVHKIIKSFQIKTDNNIWKKESMSQNQIATISQSYELLAFV